MTFKKKQFMGLGLTIFFLVLLLFVIMYMTSTIKTNMLEIVQDRYEKVNKAMEIRQQIYQEDRELLYLVNQGEHEGSSNQAAFLDESERGINENISSLEGTLNKKRSRELLNDVEYAYRSISDMKIEILDGLSAGAASGELVEIYNSESANRSTLFKTLNEFKDYQESLINEAMNSANTAFRQLVASLIAAVAAAILLISAVTLWVIRSTNSSLETIADGIKSIDYENLDTLPRLKQETDDAIGQIAYSFNSMAASLETYNAREKEYTSEIAEQNWIQTHSANIINLYHKSTEIELLADQFITKLVPTAGASLGAFYLHDGNGENAVFRKIASYADSGNDAGREVIPVRDGLVGQCAREKKAIYLNNVLDSYTPVMTAFGEAVPKSILISPVIVKDEVVAVIELANLREFTKAEKSLVEKVLETLGIAVTNILGRMEVERLLLESQAQTEELQSQSEELQAQSEELQTQAEELRMINEQLEERSKEAEQKSAQLQKAKKDLEEHAKQLQLSSKYKSEFLANMSHELRTPLNSILLLSEMLTEDEDQALTDEQKEFSRVIHTSGQDLLDLINDILDLSKVEVGKLEVEFDVVNIKEFSDRINQLFAHLAAHKNLEFSVTASKDLPDVFYTDEQRLQQIVKNLLSNAFKFTEEGSVAVSVEKAGSKELASLPNWDGVNDWLKIKVADTGIGITKEKQMIIFEAFQQGDGATMRKYGGTGLGLSISREFARLLGGVVQVESQEGKGSIFTLLIPSLPNGVPFSSEHQSFEEVASAAEILPGGDDHSDTLIQGVVNGSDSLETNILSGKKVVVVDDDQRNIYALTKALKKEGMEVITAENGLECLEIMDKTEADIVLMDIMMPVMDGYETMKRVRSMESGKDIPIVALTAKAMKGDREKCLEAGASDYVSKPLKLDQLLSVMRVWITKE
ncbi:response regulator [Mesobacillus foraminis]|uniref:response regulator n=1 Tax=Mesobacillus foraminis TaxID=279826 RepID=UPI0039A08F90